MSFQNERKFMVKYVFEVSQIKSIVDELQLDYGRITINHHVTPETMWSQIFSEAISTNKINQLLEIVNRLSHYWQRQSVYNYLDNLYK